MKRDITEGAPSRLSGAALIDCPRCAARLAFSREPLSLIDSSGFESYRLKCEQCGAELVGIIDPLDDELLVSELER
jgi:predicted nucleic acid-binding Zn ribbon protein